MKHSSVYLLLFMLCCALFAAACNYIGQQDFTACKLVTQADAERILGVPARLKTDTTTEKESTCVYADASGNEGLVLQFTITAGESEEQVRAADELAKKYVSEKIGPTETVDAVGDAAWLEKKEGSRTLHVRKKNFGFLMNAEKGINKEPSYDEMRSLAKRIADKL